MAPVCQNQFFRLSKPVKHVLRSETNQSDCRFLSPCHDFYHVTSSWLQSRGPVRHYKRRAFARFAHTTDFRRKPSEKRGANGSSPAADGGQQSRSRKCWIGLCPCRRWVRYHIATNISRRGWQFRSLKKSKLSCWE